MLSAAYGLLADLSSSAPIAQAIHLVHHRTGEVILGQASESYQHTNFENTEAHYERLARGKSASLLSLALELPLLLSGHPGFMSIAHAAAGNFAVAYQIADDLDDCEQDSQEGSSNLILLLRERDALTMERASRCAVDLATARLTSAEAQAELLPNQCAATLLQHAARLRKALAEPTPASPARAGV
jgi:geranylgeranyl pyrophosphate synthase